VLSASIMMIMSGQLAMWNVHFGCRNIFKVRQGAVRCPYSQYIKVDHVYIS